VSCLQTLKFLKSGGNKEAMVGAIKKQWCENLCHLDHHRMLLKIYSIYKCNEFNAQPTLVKQFNVCKQHLFMTQ